MDIREANLEEVWNMRHNVMWPDKDLDFVKLPDDPAGLHYGLYSDGHPVSVISLFLDGNRAQFRKFATLPHEQGKGYGSRLLEFTMDQAGRLGAETIWCNARKHKIGFYTKFGLRETDRAFNKEGVEYVILEKNLADKLE